MAKKTKGGSQGEQTESMNFETFRGYITSGNTEKLYKLGAREVLDYVMEGMATRQTPREPLAPNRLYLSYMPCNMFFSLNPVSTDFCMCLVWFLEEVGFSSRKIQDALQWFFGAEHPPADEIDLLYQREMKRMVNAVCIAKQWKVPFPEAEVQ